MLYIHVGGHTLIYVYSVYVQILDVRTYYVHTCVYWMYVYSFHVKHVCTYSWHVRTCMFTVYVDILEAYQKVRTRLIISDQSSNF